MKVNENSGLIQQATGLTKLSSSPKSTPNTGAVNTQAEAAAGPAVNLDIGLSAKLSEVQAETAETKASDQALIDKLRNQIASGEFKIDYQKISQAMLKDVVANIGQRPNLA